MLDSLTSSHSTRIAINQAIKDYEKIEELSIDRNLKSINLKLVLEGEISPVSLELNDFQIKSDVNNYSILVGEVKSNKKWIENLCQDFVVDEEFKLSDSAFGFLKGFIC